LAAEDSATRALAPGTARGTVTLRAALWETVGYATVAATTPVFIS
jgi:hypothetical protein